MAPTLLQSRPAAGPPPDGPTNDIDSTWADDGVPAPAATPVALLITGVEPVEPPLLLGDDELLLDDDFEVPRPTVVAHVTAVVKEVVWAQPLPFDDRD